MRLITRRYPLAKVNDAFTAMKQGEVAWGVIQFLAAGERAAGDRADGVPRPAKPARQLTGI